MITGASVSVGRATSLPLRGNKSRGSAPSLLTVLDDAAPGRMLMTLAGVGLAGLIFVTGDEVPDEGSPAPPITA
jgi:hypothetical protein